MTNQVAEMEIPSDIVQSQIPACETSLLSQRTINGDTTTLSSDSPSASRQPFSKLPVGTIRLLRLHPHLDQRSPLQCDLLEYPLYKPTNGTHPYEALSYVWGCGDKVRALSTAHGNVPITENLYVALLSLRDRSFPRIIWVDAVCINQDDIGERSRQVQYMAEIYAKASRVIVWLEQTSAVASDTSNPGPISRALQIIENAARGRLEPSTAEADREAVHSLFQQPWFERIWVLQEVAAARHVLMMCGGMEMDGYAFCEGVNNLKLIFEDRATQSRIGSVVYLIKGAGLRPKQFLGRGDHLSLDICTLGELVDMYHSRKATDSRDKVYALLGMSSDSPTHLSPNYEILWQDLFDRLIHYLTSDQVEVQIRDEEIAVIQGKGYVLGKVVWTSDADLWDGTQDLHVDLYFKTKTNHTKTWRRHWHLRASADSVKAGDLIILLQGASMPSIIRPCTDFCVIIAIAAAVVDKTPKPRRRLDWPKRLAKIDSFNHDLVLVWDWKMSQQSLQNDQSYQDFLTSTISKINSESEDDHVSQVAARLYNNGLLLTNIERYDEAAHAFHQAVGLFVQATSQHPDSNFLAKGVQDIGFETKVQRRARKWRLMSQMMGQQGSSANSTERGISQIARYLDENMVGQILNWHRNQFVVLEDVVLAAAGNDKGSEVLKLLRERFGRDIVITENILKAVAWSDCGGDMMEVLLYREKREDDGESDISYDSDKGEASHDSDGSDGSSDDDSWSYQSSSSEGSVKFELNVVTEDILLAIAINPSQGGRMMGLLLEKCEGTTVVVTAKVVKAAARNITSGQEVMNQFVRRDVCQMEITESVAKTVMGREDWEVDIIEMFLMRYGGEITPSDSLVAVAAGNKRHGDKLVELLIDLYGRRVDAGPEVKKAAAENARCGANVIRLLKEVMYL